MLSRCFASTWSLDQVAISFLLALAFLPAPASAATQCFFKGYVTTSSAAISACHTEAGSHGQSDSCTSLQSAESYGGIDAACPGGIPDNWTGAAVHGVDFTVTGTHVCGWDDTCWHIWLYKSTCNSPYSLNVSGTCVNPDGLPAPDGTPADNDCNRFSGEYYKQLSSYGNPAIVKDCAPNGCGLGSPSYDLSGAVIVLITYPYTGSNCADHSKDTSTATNPTASRYTETKEETKTTAETNTSTGEPGTITETKTTTTTTISGGPTQALIDKLDDINGTLSGISGSSGGASAGDIGDAVGDALKDPDDDDKPDPGEYTGAAEDSIGAAEDQMDTAADQVGASDEVGDATSDPGFGSAIGALIPSASCADYTMTVYTGHTISITCAQTSLWRSILAWFFYGGTIVALFYMFTERPGGAN